MPIVLTQIYTVRRRSREKCRMRDIKGEIGISAYLVIFRFSDLLVKLFMLELKDNLSKKRWISPL